MGRSDQFEAGSTEGTLRDLGYSDEEIGATAGSLPAQMAEEDRLRLSLRALSAEHSRQTHQRVETELAPMTERMNEQDRNKAYNEGRRDEQKDRYRSEKEAKARTPRQPRGQPVHPAGQALKTARMFGSLARKASGKRR